jgi:RNA polymerase primary sigma factor
MIISLDEALHFHGRSGLEDGPSLHEFLAAPAPDVLPDMTAIREALPELLDGLGDDEQFVLGWRFGLIDGRPRTLGEIATLVAACGTPLSHNDVYTIQSTALAKLRRPEIAATIVALLAEGGPA